VSVNRDGNDSGNLYSYNPVISADGSTVAFMSYASDLVLVDSNGMQDVFARELSGATTHLVSVNRDDTDSGNGDSYYPVISADGSTVAFWSGASDLVPIDSNGTEDVFVWVLSNTPKTQLVSVNRDGNDSGNGYSGEPVISADGTIVAFLSNADDLVNNDSNGNQDVFARDLSRATTHLASANLDGTNSGNDFSYGPVISADGSTVAFASYANNLVPDDSNSATDVFAFSVPSAFKSLISSHGLKFDIDTRNLGAGQLLQGPANAFDGLNRLQVNGIDFTSVGVTVADSGRTLMTRVATVGALEVSREITVPDSGNEDFVRTIEVLHNPSPDTAVTVTVKIVGNLGSDTQTNVFATSSGNTTVEPTDRWIGTDDGDANGGTPALIHYIHGPVGLVPSSIDVIEDNITWSYNIIVQPGQTVRLAHFTIVANDRQTATDAAHALVRNTGFDGEADRYLSSEELASLTNFQFEQDFGDAPAPYPTTVVDNGARHAESALRLGTQWDAEADGQFDELATGDDDTSSPDDEDGVTISGGFTLLAGRNGTATVTINGGGGNARLYGWIDFNRDGDWSDAGEQIFDGTTTIADGTSTLAFAVPITSTAGPTFARFRLSTDLGLSFDGAASDGEVEDYRVTIQANRAPVAVAHASNTNLGEGGTLNDGGSFDPDSPLGDQIVGYSWDISNGALQKNGPNVSLSATEVNALGAGAHTVRLTVVDTFGLANQAETTLTIYNNVPTAALTAIPTPAACNQSIVFDASASTHGRPDRSIVSYAWDFGDGSSYTETALSAPDGSFDGQTSHAYGAFGTYTATVTVTDNNVPSKTDEHTLSVPVNQGNNAPSAHPGGPYDANLGEGELLDGSGSTDPDAACGDSITSYAWAIGSVPLAKSGSQPSLSAAEINTLGVGSHAVTLTVTDTFGATNVVSTTLDIFNNVPTASFTVAPNPAAPTQNLAFDGRSSFHGRPDRSIMAYDWDFDFDGTTFNVDASGSTTNHAYGTFGTRTVALRVTDNNSPAKTHVTTAVVTVDQGNNAPLVNAGGPYTVFLGRDLVLDGSASSDPDAAFGDSIVSYAWDLDNDGQFDDAIGVDPTIAAATLAGLGLNPGTHTIGLRVTDSFGLSAVGSTTINLLAVDFGDAPDRYRTLEASGGPSHVISSSLYLGSTVTDADSDGFGDGIDDLGNASDDDVEGSSPDDENGVVGALTLIAERTSFSVNVQMTNTTGSDADLVGWIDFDRDGSFDPDEAAVAVVSDGTTSATLTWSNIGGTGGPNIVVGETFARFRLATNGIDGDNPGGPASNGEVEDYPATIQANRPPVAVSPSLYISDLIDGIGLNGNQSLDPDAALGDSIVSYDWSIANGTVTKSGAESLLSPADVNLLGVGTHPVDIGW